MMKLITKTIKSYGFMRVLMPCFILVLCISFKAVAQQTIGLQQAIDATLNNNLQIKQAILTESLDNENLKQAHYNQLPNLTTNPDASLNFGRSIDPSTNQFVDQKVFGLSGSLNSQVLLFQGGLLRNQILENKLLVDVDKSTTAKIKNDLILSVITTYLSILSDQDLLAAANQQVEISKQTLDQIQQKYDVGNNTLADLSQAKATLSTADLNQTTAQNQLDIAVLTLKQYMEMDPKTDIQIDRPDISRMTNVISQYDAQQVFATSIAINPDVKLAEIQKQASYQNIKIAQSSYYPSLALFGSVGSNYSNARTEFTGYQSTGTLDTIGTVKGSNTPVVTPGYQAISKKYPLWNQLSDNFNQTIGLSLQIPIFGRFSTRTSVRKAKINYEIAEVNLQLAKNNLNKTISQAVLDLHAADKKYASAQETYNSNKDAFNTTQLRYNVGLVNSLDYNTALINVNKSEFDMIQARYELIFRSKIIDYYLGNPITF